ncbi:hypothetical protein [Noviherbaspirillum sp. UKPF54]|uniref:hypothetical protein n=1 Tax=Noviherbaspirillum sp. UKPF54 TaxID=2601898 RepID=UPI0011B139F9|nr:hypothetical protein [Noviherbaspirillum sp. UKPF54]QDZ29969.1 hypothetical protein FAY22_19585 [Noviherbaspirillum sp. UKPF54]
MRTDKQRNDRAYHKQGMSSQLSLCYAAHQTFSLPTINTIMKTIISKKAVLSLASLTLLAACGGGGGGDGAGQTNTSAITSSNAQAVAAQALNANTAVNGGASTASGFATGVSISGTTTAQSGLVRTVLQQLYKGLDAAPQNNLVTGITANPAPVACTGGGTLSLSLTYSSTSGLSNGDSLSVTSTNCVENGQKINGKVTMTFNNLNGTIGSAYVWSATMTMTFANFTVEENGEVAGTNGDMTLAYSQTNSQNASASISGKSVRTNVARSGATVLDETLASYIIKNDIASTLETQSINLTFIDNLAAALTSYNVKTITPFKQTSGSSYPYEGAMTITAGNGSTATVTAVSSTNVRIDVDSNGDGTIDKTIDTTWVALNSAI